MKLKEAWIESEATYLPDIALGEVMVASFPLCEKLGIELIPHMAHEFGSAMRELGAHPRDIADAGSWTSEKSTLRNSQAPERAKDLLSQLKVDAGARRKAGKEAKRSIYNVSLRPW